MAASLQLGGAEERCHGEEDAMAASLKLGEVGEEDKPMFQEVSNALQRSNMYEVVVMATFGGVTMSHLHGKDSLVHPFCLFFMCLPVLSVQVTALTYLKLSYGHYELAEIEAEGQGHLLVELKVMMIIIVQATMFGRILGNLRVLIFLLTPDTWSQVQRPCPKAVAEKYPGMAWAYRWLFVAPPSILSVALHLALCYNICVESVSIILSSKSMKGAIFDSMAITFLGDLGEQWWTVVSMVLHMDSNPDFEFKPVARAKLRQYKNPTQEGKIFRKAVAVLVMLFFSIRQVYMVSIAIESSVLPAARDVCTLRGFYDGTKHGMMLRKQAFRAAQTFLLWSDPKDAIENISASMPCNTTNYTQWGWGDVAGKPLQHPTNALKFSAVILCVLLAQTWYNFSGRIMRCLERPTEDLSWGVQRLRESSANGVDLSFLKVVEQASPASEASSESSDSENLRQELQELRERLQAQDARLEEQEKEKQRMARALRRLEEKLK